MGLLGDLAEKLLDALCRVLTHVVDETKLGRAPETESRADQATEASARPVPGPERGAALGVAGVPGEQTDRNARDTEVSRYTDVGNHQTR